MNACGLRHPCLICTVTMLLQLEFVPSAAGVDIRAATTKFCNVARPELMRRLAKLVEEAWLPGLTFTLPARTPAGRERHALVLGYRILPVRPICMLRTGHLCSDNSLLLCAAVVVCNHGHCCIWRHMLASIQRAECLASLTSTSSYPAGSGARHRHGEGAGGAEVVPAAGQAPEDCGDGHCTIGGCCTAPGAVKILQGCTITDTAST